MGCHKPGNRRLLVSLVQGHSPDPGRVCSWSRWRWRRQYQARLCHDQLFARLSDQPPACCPVIDPE